MNTEFKEDWNPQNHKRLSPDTFWEILRETMLHRVGNEKVFQQIYDKFALKAKRVIFVTRIWNILIQKDFSSETA